MRLPTHRLGTGDLVCTAIRSAQQAPKIRVCDLLLPPHGDEAKRPPAEASTWVHGAHSCLLVEFGGRHILIDGGLDSSTVRTGLAEIGVDESDISLVLVSHGDTDHIGGLLDRHHDLVYCNARYVLHRELWSAWISDGKRGDPEPFYEDSQQEIALALAEQIADRTVLVGGTEEVEPGLRTIAAPGHRPSHIAFELGSGTPQLLYMGDALIAPVFVEQPERGSVFDSDPDLGIRTRVGLLRRAAQRDTVTYVPHFPFPGFVRVVSQDGHFEQRPV